MQGNLFQRKETTMSQESEPQPLTEPPSTSLDAFEKEMDLDERVTKHPMHVRKTREVAIPIPQSKTAAPAKQLSAVDKMIKKPSRPRKTENVSDDLAYLTAKIDRSLHLRLKIMSSMNGQSIKSVLEGWIQEHTPELT